MHHRSREPERSAITLIEVLLVLTLLVMLAAMTWPALDRPMSDQRLRKAADRVRTAWSKARIEAMSSGQTFLFRCTLEGAEYTIEAQAGPESVDTIAGSAQGQFDETASGSAMGEALSSVSRQLPEDIQFVDSQVDFDTRATIFGQAADSETGDSSDPIMFFPDGTTSTATIVLENRYQRRIKASLRGLTGIATVGDTYPAEDSIHAP